LEAALLHQGNGDYELATSIFLDILAADPTPEEQRLARYHLAETYSLNRDYATAMVAWQSFLAAYPEDRQRAPAIFMLARAHSATDQCDLAATHFQDYLSLNNVLADLTYERIGDCYTAQALPQPAMEAYYAALETPSTDTVQARVREKAAIAQLAVENLDAALTEYKALHAAARTGAERARFDYMAGQLLDLLGRTEEAQARYLHAVTTYPKAEFSYLSLVELVDAEVEVDELQRGLVDYYAGGSYPAAYGAAIRAFDRYLAADPAPRSDEALYFKALALREEGLLQEALDQLEALASLHPESTWLPKAGMEVAAILAEMDKTNSAVQAYEAVSLTFAQDELAPEALWAASQIQERAGELADAARLYLTIAEKYPTYKGADDALWRAGLAFYRTGDLVSAVDAWQRLTETVPDSVYRAPALFWLGRVQGSAPEGRRAWSRLLTTDPNEYYALRVAEREPEAIDVSLTIPQFVTASIEAPFWDAVQAQEDTLEWLNSWTTIPTSTKLSPLPESLASQFSVRRGQALLEAGLREQAIDTFAGARASIWDDPTQLAQMTFYLRDKGILGLASRYAARLVALSPSGRALDSLEGSVQSLPSSIQQLVYPLSYTELLSAGAEQYALDPLLLAALIRQESLFEPTAVSYAGATGLGQVMPATGQEIANRLGLENWTSDDLYRPSVSILFGAYYLADQLRRFEGELVYALAAYNGGPGNGLRWLEMSGDDPDLFVEIITAPQSRIYLQRVIEQYTFYSQLYRSD
jgi:soluble lytic murein transglycosylase